MTVKIGFAGTDGRTLLSALEVTRAKSEKYSGDFHGVVIRGTPAMRPFAREMNWPVEFISTENNSPKEYARTIIDSLKNDSVDLVIPMPESLFFNGLLDRVIEAGYGDRVAGLTEAGAFIEGDKIRCKELCEEAGIPIAEWTAIDARSYEGFLKASLDYIHKFGGVVVKYPYSAGGKGARVILSAWEIREVYDGLIKDYQDNYKSMFGQNGEWPLLIEERMSGAEISFTILVDKNGNYRILPTALDYPERFSGSASKDNPITGGMGAVSPHPMETPELVKMAGESIAEPLINAIKEKGLLRPCVLYPGCFVSFLPDMTPKIIRVCEINIRPGEPEFQPVIRRLRNPGALFKAMFDGTLNEVGPEVREEQISMCAALITGPGGPDGQKGYPWSCTKGELMKIDFGYLKKKGILVIPSAMDVSKEKGGYISDGTRVAYLNASAAVKPGQSRGEVAGRLREKILNAYNLGKVRVIPRENKNGNRLDIRPDFGEHFGIAEKLFF